MLKQGEQYSASDFVALKAKIKKEMLRRCYTGSVAAYGGAKYDFNTNPEKGGQILAEQANKIIEPMNQINNSGFSLQEIGDPAMAMNALDAKITAYSAALNEGTGHYCNASCTGLCHTACSGSCTGTCTTECGENCTTSCQNTCQGACSGECATCGWDCKNGCYGGCYGSSKY